MRQRSDGSAGRSLAPVNGPLPDARQRLAAARVARLATVRPGGGPHVVPVTFAVDGERIVTAVDHKPKSGAALQRLRNLAAHPAASVVADHYDDQDWSLLWWVRADGPAAVVHGGDRHRRAVDLLAAKYPQYRAQPPSGPVVLVTVERWSSWAWAAV